MEAGLDHLLADGATHSLCQDGSAQQAAGALPIRRNRREVEAGFIKGGGDLAVAVGVHAVGRTLATAGCVCWHGVGRGHAGHQHRHIGKPLVKAQPLHGAAGKHSPHHAQHRLARRPVRVLQKRAKESEGRKKSFFNLCFFFFFPFSPGSRR